MDFQINNGVLVQYKGKEKSIIIPEGVASIGEAAFYNCISLTSITIPKGVTSIGNSAFEGCASLAAITIPEGVASIGDHAFYNCISLIGITIPESVASIGNNAFCHGKSLTSITISEGVTSIGDEAFKDCTSLTTITIPGSVASVGKSAFEGCKSLTSITISEGVTSIGDEAFKDCTSLTTITTPKSIESVGDNAFRGCPRLADENGLVVVNHVVWAFYSANQEAVVPEGVTTIANDAFAKTFIASIQLPTTLKKLGSAFSGCDRLTAINIPEGVTELADGTFADCDRLEKIFLPSTLVEIGDSAFWGCKSLVNISIPGSVTSIGDRAFCNCKSLVNISIPKGVKVIGRLAFGQCSSLREITVPDGVSAINPRCFDGCANLTSIHLPDSVRVIHGAAFANCTSLNEIAIPDTVEEIEYSAFENCTSLKTVKYHNTRGTVSASAFEGCQSLVDENGFTIVADVLWKCEREKENVIVPEGVRIIASDAFREGWKGTGKYSVRCKNKGTLKSIVLPSTLKKILNGAFSGCENLSAITIPNGTEMIDAECFSNCGSLQNINLPASVSHIGDGAFGGCGSLKSIEVDRNNMNYSSIDGILYNKNGDTLIYVPQGKKLKEFCVPKQVKTIGAHAFFDCDLLQKIVIPANVENFGDKVFPEEGWGKNRKLNYIEMSPEAGSGTIGQDVFNFNTEIDKPLVYPKLPVNSVKEKAIQTRLLLGYCSHPEQYHGAYANIYSKYAKSHEKSLIKKAKILNLQAVEEYFASGLDKNKDVSNNTIYKPNLSVKKPSELQKVEILEEVIQKGTLEDLKAVLQTYKTFEMTARALGMAARYRGVDFVNELIKNKATFKYDEDNTSLLRKYSYAQNTAAGKYYTRYYLMMIPSNLKKFVSSYTPMCGIPVLDEMEKSVLSLEDRIEVVKFLSEREEKLGVSFDEVLFWSVMKQEFKFADALIEMGVNLQKTPVSYYTASYSYSKKITYMEIITDPSQSVYWNSYVYEMTQVPKKSVLSVLKRLSALAASAGKKLALSQKMFDEMEWNDDSLTFALDNMDFSKVNQKKVMESLVMSNGIAVLQKITELGWLAQVSKLDSLISFARKNKKTDALAWLVDYKNKTVDVQAEEMKQEKKAMKELSERPDSVSAMKKQWGYKKLDNGTLKITNYKGNDTEVVVPAMIGKDPVTVIGKDSFSVKNWGRIPANHEVRKILKSVIIPEGVTTIEAAAFFGCEAIESIQLPSTLKTIEDVAFRYCKKLKNISLPDTIENIDEKAFWGCDSLFDGKGFAVISGILVGYQGTEKSIHIPSEVNRLIKISWGRLTSIHIPESVKTIGDEAFCYTGLENVELNEGLEVIGAGAFRSTRIKEVHIPKSVTMIKTQAFDGCWYLRDVYISSKTRKFGKEVFHEKDSYYSSLHDHKMCIHTPLNSAAENYARENDLEILIANDYE